MLRKTAFLGINLLALAMLQGCFADTTDSTPQDEPVQAEDRGKLGKADLYGQCLEIDIMYCGLKSSGTCYCDELCTTYGDCCSDYEEVCDAGPSCDPTLICTQALTCVDGKMYPTGCGPSNCDAPMGDCPDDNFCGGFGGFTCDDGEYCDYEGTSCGFADQGGVCKPMPEACYELYAPVCGCDGNTYGNDCKANAAGVDIQHEGVCSCGDSGPCGVGMECQWCWGAPACVPEGAVC